MRHIAWLATLVLALALGACGDKHDDHDHDHDAHASGPHGGQILEVGDHVAHLELLEDHEAQKIVIHTLTEENKALRLKGSPMLTVKFADDLQTIEGTPVDGDATGASEWHFRHKSLANEYESGTFRVVINEQTYTVEFEHDEEHGHDEHAHDDDGDHKDGDEHDGDK